MDKFSLDQLEISSTHPLLNGDFKTWCTAFVNELNVYAIRSLDGEPWRLLREQALLSLFTTGIIRSDKYNEISAVSEACITKNGSHFGRNDLFVIKQRDKKVDAIFFEAKSIVSPTYGIKDWNEDEYKKLIESVEQQGQSYYQADPQAYNHYDSVSVISIVFYYVRRSKGKFQEYIDKVEKTMADSFYGLIVSENVFNEDYDDESGLEFFGTVKEMQQTA